MNPQEQFEAQSRELIEKWQGGDACLWEYSVSLSRLVIRVTAKDRPGNLHIICLDTEFICGSVNWENCRLEVREIDYKSLYGAKIRFALRDEVAKVEIHCGMFGAQENVEPYY
jgi:hypothetical protein